MKKIVAILMAMIMVMSVTVALAGGADKETQTNFKKVIVGFDESPNKADEKMIRDCGGKTKYTYHIINAKAVEIPEQAIENIKKNSRVEYVEEDGIVQAVEEEVIPWGVDRIDADLVWSANKGTGVKVAIIDTGIDKDHPDLQANIKGGFNFVSNHHRRPADPEKWDDDNGHGTHCAGIVAAVDNEVGVIGVAPEAYLYGVKVLDRAGSGYVTDVIAGIEWSSDNGMQVISMSLGSSSDSIPLEGACNAADGAGIVVVAAAGNSGSGDDPVNYPAKYGSVIAVSATDDTDAIASFSNRGAEVELAAPGVSIDSTVPGGYDTYSGTSMACPHVAGTAALVIDSGITGSAAVRAHLWGTAEDLGVTGKDSLYGYGLVDAFKAAGGEDITPPTISDLTPAGGAFVNTGTPTISATVTDASGIDESSIVMTVDSADVSHSYDSETGIVSYIPTTTLAEGSHTVALEVSDTESNQAIESWSFMVDTTPPAQVTGLTVTTVSSSQLNLAWTANSDADHYNVYRSTTSGSSYALIASPTTTSYSDTGLEASTTYYYTVSAVDSAGNEGTESVEVFNTTSEAEANSMHVSDIEMWYNKRGSNYYIYTKVTIFDSEGVTVPEATVTVDTTLPDGSIVSSASTTNGDGTVTFKLRSKQAGTYTSTVTDVEKSGWTYDPEGETSKTLPVP